MGDEWKGQRYGKAGERAEKTKGQRRLIKNQFHAGESQTSAENQKVGGATFPMNVMLLLSYFSFTVFCVLIHKI